MLYELLITPLLLLWDCVGHNLAEPLWNRTQEVEIAAILVSGHISTHVHDDLHLFTY